MKRAAAFALTVAGLIAALPASAAIDIVVNGVDDTIASNVRATLSLSSYAAAEVVNDQRVRQLFASAEGEASEALQAYGFYNPEIKTHLESVGDDWKATIDIVPGPPVILQEIVVEVVGPGQNHREFLSLIENPLLRPGNRLIHADYENTKRELNRIANEFGFVEGSFSRNRLEVDPVKNIANAFINYATGPRYFFGDLQIEQDVIDEDLLRRYLRFSEGDPYDSKLLLSSTNILFDTGFFSTIDVVPLRAVAEDDSVPIRVTAVAGKKHRWGLGFGYASDTAERISAAWTNRRVNRRGHSLLATVRYSSVTTIGRASYAIPVGDPALERLTLSFATIEDEPGDIKSNRYELGSTLTQIFGPWQRIIDLFVIDEDSDFGSSTQQDTFIVPGIGFSRTHSDNKLRPTRGFRIQSKLSGSHTALGASASFTRIETRARILIPLGSRNSLLLRGESGAILTGSFSNMSASQRFFAGGDNSIRGYSYKSLSPRDQDNQRIGGRYLATGSIEFTRRLFNNWGAAIFTDGGNAFDSLDDDFEASVGLGVRLFSPVGKISVDIAQSVTDSDSSKQLHISIGPDL